MTVATTVLGHTPVSTGVAPLNTPAEFGGTAALDGTHDATLPAAQRARVVLTLIRRDLAEDVRRSEPVVCSVVRQKSAGPGGNGDRTRVASPSRKLVVAGSRSGDPLVLQPGAGP